MEILGKKVVDSTHEKHVKAWIMKHVIKIQHPRNQTLITIPKKLVNAIKWNDSNLGRIWINESGNIEIEVLELDQEKNRRSGVSPDHKTD